jgi:branched-chain amino acid aminotransferase
MAPSAMPIETSTTLTKSGIVQTIVKTAPSLTATNGVPKLAELSASQIEVIPNLNPRPVPAPGSAEVRCQKVTTDHMVTCSWNATTGWQRPKVEPYGPFSIMPTASVLHYATECFEGMKAYRGYDGKLRLFRPDRNCRRMLKSSTRIALPAFDPVELQKLIEKLVAVDGPKWLPRANKGSFLYIRPTIIGTAPAIGVQRPAEALFFVVAVLFPPALCNPTGMRLLASKDDMCRAWPGGFGNAKVGANYGPSLIAQGEARDLGYDQILWLFGKEGYVTEAGASNFFVVWRTEEGRLQLVTAPLHDGIILEGVTRASVLGLARERLTGNAQDGLELVDVVERKFTMDEVMLASDEGRLVEAFGCGTAVSSVHDPYYCYKTNIYLVLRGPSIRDTLPRQRHPYSLDRR